MSYHKPTVENTRNRAKYYLEQIDKEKPECSDDETQETNRLLYLTSRYGFQVSEKLETEGPEPDLVTAARKYLNPDSGKQGYSKNGP